MMTIETKLTGHTLLAKPVGRLDTTTSPELDAALKPLPEEVTELILDLSGVEYISSAGLRVLLSLQKIMYKKGSMKVLSPTEVVSEIFEITGFNEIFTIEQG